MDAGGGRGCCVRGVFVPGGRAAPTYTRASSCQGTLRPTPRPGHDRRRARCSIDALAAGQARHRAGCAHSHAAPPSTAQEPSAPSRNDAQEVTGSAGRGVARRGAASGEEGGPGMGHLRPWSTWSPSRCTLHMMLRVRARTSRRCTPATRRGTAPRTAAAAPPAAHAPRFSSAESTRRAGVHLASSAREV